MPRNGSGTYSLPQPPFVPNTVISSSAVNSDFSDIATALTGSVASNGQTPITGALQTTLTASPGFVGSTDTTSGFGQNQTGQANIWAGGSIVATASFTGSVSASDLELFWTVGGETITDTLNVIGGTEQAGTAVTVTSNSPAVVTWTAHGFLANQPVYFTAASMPNGMTTKLVYYVVGASITTNTFEISVIAGGSAVNTTSTGTSVVGYVPASVMDSGMLLTGGLTLDNLNVTTANITNISISGLPQPVPQGYLTLVSGTAVQTGDETAQTAVYYTPFVGSWAAVNTGSSLQPYQFSQMQLTLTSSQSANNIFDIFLAYNNGTPVIGTGPVWSTVTPGSGARGTGAGTTQISRDSVTGLWVNTVSMSLIWNTGSGNTTITVPAGGGVYLGSLYMDATNGQISNYVSIGDNYAATIGRKWGVWNAYNRQPLVLQVTDSTASWGYSGNTGPQPSNNSAANSLMVFCGLAEESAIISGRQKVGSNASANAATLGVGVNSTSVISTSSYSPAILYGVATQQVPLTSYYAAPPTLGLNKYTSLEQASFGSGTLTFFGTAVNFLVTAQWRG
jgi:hypothetical protein